MKPFYVHCFPVTIIRRIPCFTCKPFYEVYLLFAFRGYLLGSHYNRDLPFEDRCRSGTQLLVSPHHHFRDAKSPLHPYLIVMNATLSRLFIVFDFFQRAGVFFLTKTHNKLLGVTHFFGGA